MNLQMLAVLLNMAGRLLKNRRDRRLWPSMNWNN